MSNSKIMNEFWGLVGSHSWAFAIGLICGMLLILFMQNATDDEPQPGINLENYSSEPTPNFIPKELR